MRKDKILFFTFILIACCGTAPAVAQEVRTPPASPMTPNAFQGYLSGASMPNSAALAPAPPAAGSAAMARDEEANRGAVALHGTPRWDMATRDADLAFPAVAQTFACALNLPIDAQQTPKTIALLRRTLVDAGLSTSAAKRLYKRERPFMSNEKPICTPALAEALRRDGSYPSGHSAIGWAFGLVLSEAAPDRVNELVARGRAFGESRLVCNVHWASDVLEGQMTASAVVARLNAEPAFQADVAAAREELSALRAKGAAVGRDCEAEARILKGNP